MVDIWACGGQHTLPVVLLPFYGYPQTPGTSDMALVYGPAPDTTDEDTGNTAIAVVSSGVSLSV